MDWLAGAFAWIAAGLMKSWLSTAFIGLAKLLFSLLPEKDQKEFHDVLLPDIPTPQESSPKEPTQ